MKKRKKSIISLSILIIAILVLALLLTLYNVFKSDYKVSDRTSQIKEKMKEGYPVLGWLRVKGTNIDYPVLYAQDDNYNLNNADIDFTWTNSSSTTLNNRVIIHGHNIRNISSKPLLNEKSFNNFENLPSFLYYDFVKDNKYIQYTINNENYLYKIYSVSMISESEFSYDENMDSKTKTEYIDKAKKDSYFDFDIDVTKDDDLITLVTCTRFFGEKSTIIKVDGRRLRENEKAKSYKVSRKDSYKEIENTMKGDESDEEV